MKRHFVPQLIVIGALAGFAGACSDDKPEVRESAPVRETSEAARDAGSRTDAAMETADVKMALTTDDAVDASDINVDTNHETKVVTLKGRVATADQRSRAEDIAKREATGYRVDNQLVVGTH